MNHGRSRTGFANARPDNLKTAERKRGMSVLVCGLINHGLHRLASLTLAMVGMLWCGGAQAAVVETTTTAFRLSIKHDGIRQSAGDETLTYSSQWDGGDGATVTIAQDGAAIAEGLTGEGTYDWGVTRNGTYVLTHTTYTNGVAGKVETATFVVTGKDVPFTQGDVTVTSYSNKYDGAAHGITVASEIVGFAVKYCDTQDGEFTAIAPTLTDVGSMTVWCEISAPGYITQTNSATVIITKREVTLTSGSDSKVYDGTALTNATLTVGGDGFADGEGATYNYTGSQTAVGESANTFTYTLNEGTKAGNYTITTSEGTLTVTKATVGPGGGGGGDEPGGGTVPTGGLSKFDTTAMYDGEGHTIDTNALTAAFGAAMIGDCTVEYAVDDGSGEGGHAGRVTLPWLAEAPVYTNAGEYVVWYKVTNPNYEDFVHAAKVTITNRPVTVIVTGYTATHTYDGAQKTVSGFDMTTEDALYKINGKTFFAGPVSAWRTEVGTTPIGLKAMYFANSDANFDVTYAVTDGWVKIEPADISSDSSPGDFSLVLGATPKYNGTVQTIAIEPVTYKELPVTYTLTGESATDAGDYTLTVTGTGNFTGSRSFPWSIAKREVTLTSGSASKVYDGSPVLCADIHVGGDGFVAGEGATYNVTGSQTTVGESANTFTYTLNEGTKAGNYTITTASGTLTVTKATVGPGGGGSGDEPGGGDVPAGGISKFDTTAIYDGEGHTINTNALVAAFGAAMIGESAVEYALDDGSGESGHAGRVTLPWLADAPMYTNVGEYVVWYRVTNPNYEDFTHAAKVTITNRPVTVTVVGHTATYTYDTTEKSVTGCEATTEDALYDIAADTAFSGGVGHAALPGSAVIFDGIAVSRTDVGTTAMGLSAGDFANNNANFAVTYLVTDGGLTIEPRVIGDDPANWDIRLDRAAMYDGTEKTAPIIQVCYVKPDGNLDYIPYTLSGHKATDAGNYVVRITGTGNYSGTVEKDWAIMPRNVTLTSGGAAWTYDGAAHSQTAVSVTGDGFVSGEGASYSGFPAVTHVADAATPIANAFTYTLNAGTKAGNYVITTANGTVQMMPRAITLTAPTKSKPYDGQPLTFEAGEIEITEPGHAGRVTLPNGEAFTLSNFSSITEAGRVDATFTIADGTARMNDYAITTVPGSLTVTRSATEITVTAKSGSWTYDGTAHALHEYEATNLGTLIAGDVLEVAFSDESVVTTPVDGPLQDGVVANTITGVRVLRNGSEDVTANYTVAAYPGTLTVVKRPVTLTSKSDTKAYDGTPLTAHEVNVGGDGFVGADGATYSFTGTQTEKGTSKNAFAYTLKNGTNAAFYEITKVEGDLEVTAADISTGDDGDWVVVFGPALTYTGLEQIQTLSSVTYKGLPLDYSVTGNARTDAGTYQMTLTGQGNFTGEHAVEWSIAPKALTLMAGSGSRVYDGTAFTVGTVTASGFVAGEGAIYQCAGSQTDVGNSANEISAIGWNANTKAGNYAVTKVAGTLTVTKRPVTLTAANISKPYDGTPLALTAADIEITEPGHAGRVPLPNGESFVFSNFASRTEAGQTPATFSYAAGPGTSLDNYAVSVTQGRTITITKSATAISVTAASEEWVYDGEAHSNRTWTATNLDTLQGGDVLEVVFDDESIVLRPIDGPAQDGVVANVITGVRVLRNGGEDVTANYTVEWFPGTLTVTKRPVTVTVTGHTATHTYDGTEKTVTGFEATTEDALYDIAADTVFSGSDEVKRTDAGKTDMGLSTGDFTNNNDCFEVTYAVTDGWVKVDPLDISSGTGPGGTEPGDFSLVIGANPKYNGTVQTIPVESATYNGLPVTFTIAGENATHAGTYTLTVKGSGNFTGERSTTWQIQKRVVTLTSGSAAKVYDGAALVNGSVVVGGDGFIGLEGAAFDITGRQTVAGTSKNTFTYTLKAGTLASNYDIEMIEGDLTIMPKPLSEGMVSVEDPHYVYDGVAKKPVVTVVHGGYLLSQGSDYDVVYVGNIGVGEAQVVVLGKGNYSGSATATFSIAVRGEGTVTPPKTWKAGQKVTWKAAAAKGSVFAHWEGEFVDSLGLSRNELRNPSLQFAAPANLDTNGIKAVFIALDDDGLSSLSLSDPGPLAPNVEVVGLELLDDSESYVTARVSGLPAGLKFNAKTLAIAGKPTKPGMYTVKITAKNASGYQWAENVELRVADIEDARVDFAGMPADGTVGIAYAGRIVAGEFKTLSVSGLPAGLKFDAKTGVVAGTPTKGGIFTVTVKANYPDKTTATATWLMAITPLAAFVEPKRTAYYPLTILFANAAAGTTTGTGVYMAGKKVAISAKPAKGWVFAGWFRDANMKKPMEFESGDWRAAKQSVIVPEVRYLYARFVTTDDDRDSIALSVDGVEMAAAVSSNLPYQTNVWCGVNLEWPVAVEALSQPTVKVAGLPSGLKFTAKDIVDSKTKQVTVPANTIYGAPTAASKTKTDKSTGAVTVTPSAVKVTVTTAGKSSQTFPINLYVDPLPVWAVGSFDGYVAGTRDAFPYQGQVTMTVAANGKISGKVLEGGKTWTMSAASFDFAGERDAHPYQGGDAVGSHVPFDLVEFHATVIGKAGKEVVTNEVEVASAVVDDVEVGVASSDDWAAYQNLWKRTDVKAAMPLFKKNFERTLELGEPGDENSTVKLTFKKDGVVAFTGKVGGTSVSGSSQLVWGGGSVGTALPGWQVTLYAPPKETANPPFAGWCETFAVTLTTDDQGVVTDVGL